MKTTFKLANKIEINRMGYGAMQLTGSGIWGDPADRNGAIELLKAVAAAGVNFIDTADAYGPETNEVLIADALYPYREKNLVIATKGGLERSGPGQWNINGHPEHIQKAIEGSLKRLRVKSIDLWQLHRVDETVPLEETLAPVAAAVKAGKIKHVGLSEVSIEQIEKAQKIVPIVSVQNLYNLEELKWDGVIDYTRAHGLAFIPWFPLGSGPDKFSGDINKIAQAHRATVAQIALAWLLKRSDNILLIPGTKSLQHLQENLGALKIDLSSEEFQLLYKQQKPASRNI